MVSIKVLMGYFYKTLCCAVLAVCFFSSSAFSIDIFIMSSSDIIPYSSCVEGIKEPLAGFSLQLVNIKEDLAKGQETLQKIIKKQPKCIIAVGPQAAFVLSQFQEQVPRFFCMVLNPERTLGQQGLYPGVSLNIPPGYQIKKIKEAFPERQKMGIFYSPSSNQSIINSFFQEAAGSVFINTFPVSSAQGIADILNSRQFAVDVLLIIPDKQLGKTKIVEYLIKQCLRRKIPVVGYNSWFAKNGALLSFIVDYKDVGIQTGQMVKKIIQDDVTGELGVSAPANIKISIDLKTAKKLGIAVSPAIVQQADEVIE